MLRAVGRTTLYAACLAVSFAYGAAVVHYQWFPFSQLRELKRVVVPELRLPRTYQARSSHFALLEEELEVVVVGDSHVHRAEWAELFPDVRIGNRGISGDRTDGVLRRLDEVLATGARLVVLEVGFNDLRAGVDVERVAGNYGEILRRLTGGGMDVVVVSTLLAARRYAATNARTRELNERLRARAERSDRVSFLDLNPILAPRGHLEERYSADGIHLSGAGYRVWQEELRRYLDDAEPAQASSTRAAPALGV